MESLFRILGCNTKIEVNISERYHWKQRNERETTLAYGSILNVLPRDLEVIWSHIIIMGSDLCCCS